MKQNGWQSEPIELCLLKQMNFLFENLEEDENKIALKF
tara:strand:+ start:514 stop:627 length:114 start_codon:yes stop_codon:yes gene_type:complete